MSLLLLFNQATTAGPGGYTLLPRPQLRPMMQDWRYRDDEEAIVMLVAKYLELREVDYVPDKRNN